MLEFSFTFQFAGSVHEAECEPIPLDGSTALYITPTDPELFNRYGRKILKQLPDGRLTATTTLGDEERNYVTAVAKGLAAHYNKKPETPE